MSARRFKFTQKTKIRTGMVYVGRGKGALFGNPFVSNDPIKAVETFKAWLGTDTPATDWKLPEGVSLAKPWLSEPCFNIGGYPRQDVILGHMEVLAGKALGCWCDRGKPCHGDILLALANALPLPVYSNKDPEPPQLELNL